MGGGDTMTPSVDDAEGNAWALYKKHKVGAFGAYNKNDNPPTSGITSPDANYYPLTRKMLKKKMRKR